MPEIINPVDFRRIYRQSVGDVMRFITRDRQELLARHDLSLNPDRHDLGLYLAASEHRYLHLLHLLNLHARYDRDSARALEVGGFLGAYPLTLVRMGISVVLVEQYGYYYGAFDELGSFLRAQGVEIWDADFTQARSGTKTGFNLITNMAMLEHLPDSPRELMRNIRSCIDDDGLLIIEIPNIAYWPNRLDLLRGRTIHQPLELVYASASPYLGHHREYTISDVRALLTWTGFDLQAIELFNYSLSVRRGTVTDRLYTLLVYLWPTLLFPACREIIMAAATPSALRDEPDALRLLRPTPDGLGRS